MTPLGNLNKDIFDFPVIATQIADVRTCALLSVRFAGHFFDQHSNSVSFFKNDGLYFKVTAQIICSVLLCIMEAPFQMSVWSSLYLPEGIMVFLSPSITVPKYI
jgi:hypothetical protein